MPVLYEDSSNNDTASALIPAPFVNISKDYNKTSDGKKIGSTYTINLEGTILPDKGSPHSDATFYTSADGSPNSSSKYNSESYFLLKEKNLVFLHGKAEIQDLNVFLE